MKSCNEMVNSLLERKVEFEIAQKRKNKIFINTLACACLLALFSVGFLKKEIFENQPAETLQDSVIVGEKDWYGPDEEDTADNQNAVQDIRGMIVYEGRTYIQSLSNDIDENDLILDKKIGDGSDFEGTYNGTYCISKEDLENTVIASEVYTVKDHPELLLVKLSNGDTVILENYSSEN